MEDFVAIDFETATGYRNSACSVALVTVKDGVIVDEFYELFQPPNNEYWNQNIRIHRITPEMTATLPSFGFFYTDIKERLLGKVVVAHNESFDRSVLTQTMRTYGYAYEELDIAPQWECTCKICRSKGYPSARLDACCQINQIPLKHHEALSDARACAQLYLKYLRDEL